MRALLMGLCALLMACDPPPQRLTVRLVCAVEGEEVYRSQAHPWLKFNNGVWWTAAGDWKYQPSPRESCRTEQV